MLKIKKFKIIFTFLLLINLTVWFSYFSLSKKFLSISFVDVGNGDGIFIKTPDGFNVVVDGGPDNKFSNYLGLNFPFLNREIDLLVLTHPHEDHINGAIDILKNYKVKNILGSGVLSESPAYINFIDIAKEKNINFIIGQEGQNLNFGDLNVKVLFPFENLNNKKMSNINNSSLILNLRYKDFSCTLLGDIEKDMADEILFSGVNIDSDIIKVSHQGSKNGVQNVSKFLDISSPNSAIISVGDNNYGHPSNETLDILLSRGIEIYRTDVDGTIIIESDGNNYWVRK